MTGVASPMSVGVSGVSSARASDEDKRTTHAQVACCLMTSRCDVATQDPALAGYQNEAARHIRYHTPRAPGQSKQNERTILPRVSSQEGMIKGAAGPELLLWCCVNAWYLGLNTQPYLHESEFQQSEVSSAQHDLLRSLAHASACLDMSRVAEPCWSISLDHWPIHYTKMTAWIYSGSCPSIRIAVALLKQANVTDSDSPRDLQAQIRYDPDYLIKTNLPNASKTR